MKDKGMGLLPLIITITVLIILVGVTIGITCGAIKENETKNVSTEQKNCQHDWVITSKYDWIRKSYKTISKCSICGKEVE